MGQVVRQQVCGDWKVSSKVFRVDCPHQKVCAMRGCVAGADGVDGDGCLQNDGGRECRGEVYGDCKVSSKAFRVDCSHQNVCTIPDCDAGADGVDGYGCLQDDGGRECRREVCGDCNASMRPL